MSAPSTSTSRGRTAALRAELWTITRVDAARYVGRADDVVGEAIGEAAGNALRWRYVLALPVDGRVWNVDLDDWMFLIDEQVMLNRSQMKKFGFHLGDRDAELPPAMINPCIDRLVGQTRLAARRIERHRRRAWSPAARAGRPCRAFGAAPGTSRRGRQHGAAQALLLPCDASDEASLLGGLGDPARRLGRHRCRALRGWRLRADARLGTRRGNSAPPDRRELRRRRGLRRLASCRSCCARAMARSASWPASPVIAGCRSR
jgi:hypothetical protein